MTRLAQLSDFCRLSESVTGSKREWEAGKMYGMWGLMIVRREISANQVVERARRVLSLRKLEGRHQTLRLTASFYDAK